MAKRGESDSGKAAAIRDFMKANPKVGPKAVAAALKEQGIDVSAAYVSTIKSLSKKRGRRRGSKDEGAEAAPAATAAPAVEGLSISILVQAKKLASQLGGVAQAKAALDALSKLGL